MFTSIVGICKDSFDKFLILVLKWAFLKVPPQHLLVSFLAPFGRVCVEMGWKAAAQGRHHPRTPDRVRAVPVSTTAVQYEMQQLVPWHRHIHQPTVAGAESLHRQLASQSVAAVGNSKHHRNSSCSIPGITSQRDALFRRRLRMGDAAQPYVSRFWMLAGLETLSMQRKRNLQSRSSTSYHGGCRCLYLWPTYGLWPIIVI